MSHKNLEELLRTVGNPVNMIRNSQIGAYVYPVVPPNTRIGAMSSGLGANRAYSSINPITWWTSTSRGPTP